jgi:hypothetical protein
MKNYYEILGVNHYSSEDDIRKAYFKLAKEYHPDVNNSHGSEKIFKGINEAYAVLSDSLRRADYDQMLQHNFIKEKMEKERDEAGNEDEDKPNSTRMQFAAAFGRVVFSIFIGALVGALVEFIAWYLISSKSPIVLQNFYPSILWGAILGLFWGADLNFDVEEFFGPGYIGRTYTFLRTFVYAISFAFLAGRFFNIFSSYFKSNIPSLLGSVSGVIIGGSLGSQGNGIFMLKENEGRFSLFYTAVRAILIGIIVAIVAFFLGVTLEFVAGVNITIIATFVGFLLGVIFGSVSPPNLSAYASYASSAVKNSMIIIVAVLALIIGAVIAYLFHTQIDKIITRIF